MYNKNGMGVLWGGDEGGELRKELSVSSSTPTQLEASQAKGCSFPLSNFNSGTYLDIWMAGEHT